MTRPQDSETWGRLKRVVGGKPLRIHIGAWIAEHDGANFSQQEIADDIQYSAGAISTELRSTFVTEGLVLKAPDRVAKGVQFYTRIDSPWWEAFRAIKQAADAGTVPLSGPLLEIKRGGAQGRRENKGDDP